MKASFYISRAESIASFLKNPYYGSIVYVVDHVLRCARVAELVNTVREEIGFRDQRKLDLTGLSYADFYN